MKKSYKNLKIERKKILIFVGSPRAGTTLLGQILNNHPSCLISNESRFIDNVVNQKTTVMQGINNMMKDAFLHYMTGLENDKVHFAHSMERFQKKWISFSAIQKAFPKNRITVIGDKKSGGSTQTYIEKQAEFISFVEKQLDICFIQIVRNPIDTALSYMKSHQIEDFSSACQKCVSLQSAAFNIGTRCNRLQYLVYYENLIDKPHDTISKILNWIGVPVDAKWLDMVAEIIVSSEPKNYLEDHKKTANFFVSEYDAHDVFSPYALHLNEVEENNY